MAKIERGKPFSSGMEYEWFRENFCDRCKNYVENERGFPAFEEEGGCKILDAMENARWGAEFPGDEVVTIKKGDGVIHWHVCTGFEAKDETLMAAYRRLFDEEGVV